MISEYFIYDPDYAFLNLGVVSVIKEIEYMNFLNEVFGTTLKWYSMGEMVTTCPKVNYKMNYKPGEVLDMYTFKWIKLTDEILEKMKLIS